MKDVLSRLDHQNKALAHLEKHSLAAYDALQKFDGTPVPRKRSQYVYKNGVRYERNLLEIASDKEITTDVAEKLWETAMDGNVCTPTEKRTLRYIAREENVSDAVRNYFETKMGS